MFNYLEQKYRQLPHGYPKIIIKNILGFLIHNLTFQTEQLSFDGTNFLVYKTRLYNNQELLSRDIKGYIHDYKLKRGDVVIDAGAYNGLFTIYAAIKVGSKGKVFAFEPDPFNSNLLKKNLMLNNLKNVKVIKKGLYNKEGVMKFDIQGLGSNIITNQEFPTLNSIEVTTLDKELKKLKIKKVDFVKMDIEGAENEAVYGSLETIKNSNNIHFAIASYHIVDGKQTKYFITGFFKKLGFKVFTKNLGQQITYASRK
jgi:FkbM family methyltransferase